MRTHPETPLRTSTTWAAAAAFVVTLTVLPSLADATVRAHFTTTALYDICAVDRSETFGDAPEVYFNLGIFDLWSDSIFRACDDGCSDDGDASVADGATLTYCSTNSTCGTWDIPNRTLTKVIPPQSGVYFYFGLWDDDTFDADDSLGDHWFWTSQPISSISWNNNGSPYYADEPISTVCGRDVESVGNANNYRLQFEVYFSDDTSPTAPSGVTLTDSTAPAGFNDDGTLTLQWTAGSDPDSGISTHHVELQDDRFDVVWSGAVSGTSLQICAGCTASFAPIDGRRYRARVGAENGRVPELSSTSTSWSGWSGWIDQDATAPTTAITSPSEGSWQRQEFAVLFDDQDAHSGLDTCEWRVVDDGAVSRSWSARTCDGSVAVTVCASGCDCSSQGEGVCRVEGRVTDEAANDASTARAFDIDHAGDAISGLTAATSAGGSTISASTWQADRDPYFSWSAPSSASSITGYSWEVDGDPDCVAEGADPAIALDPDSLEDGKHTFSVRSLDEAGNCGPVAELDVWVDGTSDDVTGLAAAVSNGGAPIAASTWQSDDDPYFSWSAPSSASPIAGYSWAVDADPDCTAEGSARSVSLATGSLADGVHTFAVRAIDQAGNCGAIAEIEIWVDDTGDAVPSLQAWTELFGDSIEPGIWQTDDDPYLSWGAASSASPVVGYSWAVDSTPGCAVDVTSTSVSLGVDVLSNGARSLAVRAIDEAGNCGAVRSITLLVDDAGDEIAAVSAFTASGGTALEPEVWQTDATPYFSWDAPTSNAPITGYAWTFDEEPPCMAEHASPSVQIAEGTLSDGIHLFRVRAVDAAGNCGAIASFEIWVDAESELVTGLGAFTTEFGDAIEAESWQTDRDPYFAWDDLAAGGARVSGYSWALGTDPDCTVDQTSPGVQLADGALEDGTHSFRVRAIDEADNCGAISSVELWVDGTPEVPGAIEALTSAGGSAIAPSVWQTDTSPWFSWPAAAGSASPIEGYSHAFGIEPDCIVESAGTSIDRSADPLDPGSTTLFVRAVDAAGNCSDSVSFVLLADDVAERPDALAAFTQEGGTPIAPASWQSDADPWFSWDDPAVAAPAAGYSVAVDEIADCTVDTTTTEWQVEPAVAEGTHELSVRMVDEAGNCSDARHFAFWVDTGGDEIAEVRVRDSAAGEPFDLSGWISDRTLYYEWDAPTGGAAPVEGYSWAIDAAPDCVLDVIEPTLDRTAFPLTPGMHTFSVRALDTVGSCGPIHEVSVNVDDEAEPIVSLTVLESDGGAEIGVDEWTAAREPLASWTDASEGAPTRGYSWAIDGDPDCVEETAETSLSLGPLTEGSHTIAIRTVDEADNCSDAVERTLSIDSVAEVVADLVATTSTAGETIDPATWQPDDDPVFSWTAPTSTAPLLGYSWAIGEDADCTVETSGTLAEVDVDALENGTHEFAVRVLDSAGNCGDPVSYSLFVDDAAEPPTGLRALTSFGGTAIDEATWQPDADPRFEWDDASANAPADGFSVAVDATSDCDVDTVSPNWALGAGELSEGEHVFVVRTIDVAGNCSVETSFEIWVSAEVGSIENLKAFTALGGPEIPAGSWQDDRDPYFSWTAPADDGPDVVGYSWAVDDTPDCEVDVTDTGVALGGGALADGPHAFSVRAIDEADGCGPIATFDIFVDQSAELPIDFAAFDARGGDPISASTWQRDDDPYLTWADASVHAPIDGYSVAWDASPDCGVDTRVPELAVATDSLANGARSLGVRAIDLAGNCSDTATFVLFVDDAGDDIAGLTARTAEGGDLIAASTWQLDATPWFEWPAPTGGDAPIAGYAWATDDTPTCEVATTERGVQLADGVLGEGEHTFSVLAVDEAGNCGAPRTFDIWIDQQAEPIASLRAFVAPGGAEITDGEWQQDDDPYFVWSFDDTGGADVTGYSYATDTDPDCTVETANTSLAITSGLWANGTHTFGVRVIDSAGNCSDPVTMTIRVDDESETASDLRFLDGPDGEELFEGSWYAQPEPAATWSAPTGSASPLAGYSWAIDADPGCTVDGTETTLDFAGDPLADGTRTLSIRTIDEAGNCSDPVEAGLSVDTLAEPIRDLRAFTSPGGDEISAGVWQPDADPHFTWVDDTEGAPAAGFSVGIDADASCVVDALTSRYTFPEGALAGGEHTIEVRAVDEAGNCSEPVRFELLVDRQGDVIDDLALFTEVTGDPIDPETWQTDADPWISWSGPASGEAAVAGYSWAVDEEVDCDIDVVEPGVQLADDTLADGVHMIEVRSIDEAGNCGPIAQIEIWVDTLSEAPEGLTALDSPGGDALPSSEWQRDATPTFSWTDGSEHAPLVGYSWAIDEEADCEVELTEGELSTDDAPLVDGEHTFEVRAVDAAGNCSDAVSVALLVDGTEDTVAGLTAHAALGGLMIAEATWQSDADPVFAWEPSSGTAPAAGYSVSTTGEPDCVVDTADEVWSIPTPGLDDGEHLFSVRAVDAAENCGPVETFNLLVDTFAEPPSALSLSTELGGEAIEPAAWQDDADPYLVWSGVTDGAPPVGWATSIDAEPACEITTAESSWQLAAGELEDGVHTLFVRTLDEAENCSEPIGIEIWVDRTNEDVVELGAWTEEGGEPITARTWQQDATPYFTWTATGDVDRVVGYSTAMDADPDCLVDRVDASRSFAEPLTDGQHSFAVRAIDASGTCGAIARFAIWVDRSAEPVSDLWLVESIDEETEREIRGGGWSRVEGPVAHWVDATTGAPTVGFGLALDGDAPCEVTTTADQLALDGSAGFGPLAAGDHRLFVRVLDEAGNCSDSVALSFGIDMTADEIATLRAFTDIDGAELAPSSWQSDATPAFVWTSPADAAPRAGYAVAFGGEPRCEVTQTEASMSVAEPGLADGEHQLFVRALDEAGNCGPSAAFDLFVDTSAELPTGLVARTEPGGEEIRSATWQSDADPWFAWEHAAEGAALAGFSVAFDDAPDCEIDTEEPQWGATAPLSDGEHTFQVRAVDAAGNCSEPATFAVWVSTANARVFDLSATDRDGNPIIASTWQRESAPTFTWSSDEGEAPLRGYSVAIDGEPDCDTVETVEAVWTMGTADRPLLADGRRTFAVRAVDEAGNCGASTSFSIFVDATPDPIEGLTAFTARGGVAIAEDAPQSDATPIFSWEPAESVSPIDGYAWAYGEDPGCEPSLLAPEYVEAEPGLEDGTHRFAVRVIDEAGNCGPVADFTLRVDTSGAAIAAIRAFEEPGGAEIEEESWTQDAGPTFVWEPEEPGEDLAYSYTFDDEPDCVAELDVPELSIPPGTLEDGDRTFAVRIIDGAGNCGIVARFTLRVDTVADAIASLVATRDGGDDVLTDDAWMPSGPQLTWEPADSTAPIVGFGTAVDDEAPCAVTTTDAAMDLTDTELESGPHRVAIKAIDAAGNCGPAAAFRFRVDGLAERIVDLQPYRSPDADTPIDPDEWVADTTLSWRWDVTESLSPLAGFDLAVDEASDCVVDQVDPEWTAPDEGLGEGERRLTVRAVDAAGNCGEAAESVVRIDATEDEVTGLAAWTDVDGAPIEEGRPQADPDPVFTWDEALSVAPIVGYSYALNEEADCTVDTEETTAALDESEVQEGENTFAVRAIDAAGNCGPASSFVVVVVGEAPQIDIVSVTPTWARADVDVDVRFDVDRTPAEPPRVVVAGGEAVRISGDGARYHYRYRTTGDEREGERTVAVTVVDEAGIEGSAVATVQLDFTPPSLRLTRLEPEIATTGDRIAVTVETNEPLEGPPTVTVGGVRMDHTATFDDAFGYIYLVPDDAAEGLLDVVARGEDLAGNSGEIEGEVVVDATPPAVVILEPAERGVFDLGDPIAIRWETTDAHPEEADVLLSRDGGESFEALATGIDDDGQFEWTASGAPTTDGLFRVVARDVVGLEAFADSAPCRIRSGGADHVIATADDGEASVGSSELVTLQVVDELSDPVAAAFPVTLELSGSARFVGTTLEGATTGTSTISGVTGEDGRATVTVLDDVPELVELTVRATTLPEVEPSVGTMIRFVADDADHLALLVDDGVADVGESEALEVQLVDTAGNVVAADLRVELHVTGEASFVESDLDDADGLDTNRLIGKLGPDGIGTVSVRSDAEGEVEITASDVDGLLPAVVPHETARVAFVHVGIVDPTLSTITVEPPRVIADGVASALATVQLFDRSGAPVDEPVDLELEITQGSLGPLTDDGPGRFVAVVTSEACDEETPAVVTATADGTLLDASAEVTFVCDAPTGAEFLVDPERVVADGEQCATISLTPLDEAGAPWTRDAIIEIERADGEPIPVEPGPRGSYVASYCPETCSPDAPVRFDAYVDGLPITALDPDLFVELTVDCLGVDGQASTVDVTPDEVRADGLEAATIRVVGVDTVGAALDGELAVELAPTLGEVTEPEQVEPGVWQALWTSEDAGAAEVFVTIAGVALEDRGEVVFLEVDDPGDIGGAPEIAVEHVVEVDDLAELDLSGAIPVRVRLTSQNERTLEDVSLTLSLDPLVAFAAQEAIVDGELVALSAQSERVARIDLGSLEPNGRIELIYQVEVAADPTQLTPETVVELVARAFVGDEPASDPKSLTIELGAALDDLAAVATTSAACGACGHVSWRATARGSALPMALVVLGLVLVRRRGRRSGSLG